MKPHIYFRNGAWHCKENGQEWAGTSIFSAFNAYLNWKKYTKLF